MSKSLNLTAGARGSRLSQIQVWEVEKELQKHYPHVRFFPIWVSTKGDKDQKSSLLKMEKTDFFTHEIDTLHLKNTFRIAIHSAKDLPDPLPEGLTLVALTKGLSNHDVLVLREGETLEDLPQKAPIGTSSDRRIVAIRTLRPDLTCVDIRGTIEKRLAALDKKEIDGLVVALCALERLKERRNQILLSGTTVPLQGKLAILALSEDQEMKQLFEPIHDKTHSLSGQ